MRFDGQTKITAPRKIDCACGLGNEQVIAALGEIRLPGYDNLEVMGTFSFGVGYRLKKERSRSRLSS